MEVAKYREHDQAYGLAAKKLKELAIQCHQKVEIFFGAEVI